MDLRFDVQKPNGGGTRRVYVRVEITTFTCVTCQEVGLIWSEGLKRCFEGLFHPEIAFELDFTSSLTWCSTLSLNSERC